MTKERTLSQHEILIFIEEKLTQNDIFALLNGFCYWVRHNNQRTEQLYFLIKTLKQNKALTQQLSSQLCRWLCNTRLYPL